MDAVGPGQSVRRKSRVLRLRRQSYYRRKAGHRPEEEDQFIAELLCQTTQRFISWGFWLVFYFLRNQGYSWNHKKVYRIWKEEGLNLRKVAKRPKIKRKYQALIAPEQINEGWAMDFLSDWVVGQNQQQVRIFNLVDEASRKALWLEGHRSISAKKVIQILDQAVQWRGKPRYIRCDNGPEFIAHALQQWTNDHGIELKFTQPGKPTQNGICERLNGTIRRDCLHLEWFASIKELNDALQKFWQVYNQLRPHQNLGYKTPDQFEQINQKFYFRSVA